MKQYEYKGNIYTITQLAKLTGMPKATVKSRLYNGWSIKKIIETPKCEAKLYEYKGKKYTTKQLSEVAHISKSTLLHRLASGMSIDEAVNKPKYRYTEKKYLYEGKEYTLAELEKMSGICKDTIYTRIKRGMSVKEAVETEVNGAYKNRIKEKSDKPFDWDRFYINFMNREYGGDIRGLMR